MPTPGKNFSGQRGFPTPNDTPGVTTRRIFIVPNSAEWLGLLEGAAQVLLDEWRYYDWGALTPAETVAAFNDAIIASYTNKCQCELPGGGSVLRLNPSTGHLEELGEDGAWDTPSGEYAVPPVLPREGGTPEDQKCLAAANAAHVLEVLYESITDSISGGLTTAEAYTAMIEAFIAAVGWEFAPIAAALAAFFLVVFAVVYAVINIIGADLWSGTFTDTLKCALYECASDDGLGVITFDWPCLQAKLAAGTDALDFDQLRLFNQLNFIIQVIGGADGLNLAGATTSVLTADCSGCSPRWHYCLHFPETDGGMSVANGGTYVGASGWETTETTDGGDHYRQLTVQRTLVLGASTIDFIQLGWDEVAGIQDVPLGGARVYQTSDSPPNWLLIAPSSITGDNQTLFGTVALTGTIVLGFNVTVGYHVGSDPGGSATAWALQMSGTGDSPFGSDNEDCFP